MSASSRTSSRRSRGSGASGQAVAAALSGRRKGHLLRLVGDRLPDPKEKASRSKPALAPTEETVNGKNSGANGKAPTQQKTRPEEAALQAKPTPTTKRTAPPKATSPATTPTPAAATPKDEPLAGTFEHFQLIGDGDGSNMMARLPVGPDHTFADPQREIFD